MTGKKELKIAKSMFKDSLTVGIVDAKKVNSILKHIKAQKHAHLVKILKAYKRLVRTALSKEEVVIESATKIANISEFEKEIKTKTKAKRVVYKVNPKILLGARITHGDWIFDSTLDSKLNQITKLI